MPDDNVLPFTRTGEMRRLSITYHPSDDASVARMVDALTAAGFDTSAGDRDVGHQSDTIRADIRRSCALLVVVPQRSQPHRAMLADVEYALKIKRAVFVVLLRPGDRPEGGLAYHLASHPWLPWYSSPQAVIDHILASMPHGNETPRPSLWTVTLPSSLQRTSSLPVTRELGQPIALSSLDNGSSSPVRHAVYVPALPSGSVVGSYTIESTLAVSCQSIAYKATDDLDGRPYFLKEFCPHSHIIGRSASGSLDWRAASWWSAQARAMRHRTRDFAGEGHYMATVAGTGVPAYVATLRANGTLYLVSDFIDGSTWAHQLQARGRVSWTETLSLMLALLRILRRCHGQGVVHGDIHPSNILVDASHSAYLVDFGASRSLVADRPRLVRAVTPGYSPPEVIVLSDSRSPSNTVGPWTDLFSLGAVAFVSLVGRLPRIGALGSEVRLLTRLHDIPPQLVSAIGWCLSIDPPTRPQRVEDVIHLLGSVSEDTANTVPPL